MLISRIGAIGGATLFISLIVSIAIVDSQFINIFYGTELSYPGTLHLSLFILFVIAASVANVVLLLFLKTGDFPIVVNRGFLKIIYFTTSAVQVTICDPNGKIMYSSHREGVKNLLTQDESKRSLELAANAWRTRSQLEPKLGKGRYVLRCHKK